MKRFTAVVMALIMLTCMVSVSAGTAGGSSDPLISLSYLNGAYSAELLRDGGELIEDKLNAAYDTAFQKLDELYRSYVGYKFAPRNTEIALDTGKKLTLITGGSFFLLSGSASIYVSSGTVVNASTGFEVSSGSLLTPYHRYFCTENTIAVITAASDASGQLDGYYNTDGVINPNGTIFYDVRKSDWFFPAVDYVYNNGLFAGTSADTFSPGTAMTRAMFVTVLYRLDGSPPVSIPSVFSDVSDPSQYYYAPVVWANENSVVSGMGDGIFGHDRSITREQMAVIMYRYAEYKGFDLTADGNMFEGFPDKNAASAYAVDALRWATARAVINGSDGKLLPGSTATRAQVAQIIYNFTRQINSAAG